LANLARSESPADIRAATWSLLATIITTQPGCAGFATASPSDTAISGTLELAVQQIIADDLQTAPNVLAASLRYVQALLDSPSTGKSISALRTQTDFWLSVYDIATRPVPAPPTFTLSMHSDDFASRIQNYTYSTQAKANAISILASELTLSAIEAAKGSPESKVQILLVGLFRNIASLTEATVLAGSSNCMPELHEKEVRKLSTFGVQLPGLKTIALPVEREFGLSYLYGKCGRGT